MSSAELAELAFEQSQRRLDKQERVLEELRARTAILLAASSLAASFLGREAFGDSGWDALAVAAGVSFLVTMLAAGVRPPAAQAVCLLDRFWEENDLEIARLRWGVQLAAAGLIVEVLALVALVADTIA